MMQAIPIYIGFDSREASAYHVCCQSIIERATVPVAFHPLALNLLQGYTETHQDGSNAFIYSRFLVPWLQGTGHAIYLDGDMLVRGDVAELWALRRFDQGVQVVKHKDYETKAPLKYLGAKNENYPYKNWSSVMLWNAGFQKNRRLTPQFIAKQSGRYLHRFEWLDDDRVGELPATWNHLVAEYEPSDAKLYHFTLGAPCFGGEYAQQEGAWEWQRTLQNALAPLGGPATTG